MATSSAKKEVVKKETSSVAARERALARAVAAAQTAHENKARDIQILDLRELTRECD